MPEESNKNGTNNKIIWVAGAILFLGVLLFGLKTLLFPASYKVTLVSGPSEISEGSTATFTWRVDGTPVTINHTAVYFGLVSNPGELGPDVKPQDTKYTENVKDFDKGEYNIPLQFVGNSKVSTQGEYFFRVNALVNGKNYWSEENTFTVKKAEYKVVLIDAPKQVTAGSASFTWKVEGPPVNIDSTAVYFGHTSAPGSLGKGIKPEDTKYSGVLTDFIKGSYSIPLQFVGNLKISTPGVYFFRVHANINGENYWTSEGTFEAVKAE